MGTHTSILACEIPWTEDLGRPTVHGVARVGHHLVIKQQQGMCYWKKDNLWYIVAKKLIEFVLVFVEVQFSSVPQSCPTLWDPMDCSTPDFPVHHQLSELAQTHVHWIGNAIQPSNPLSSPSPSLKLSQHQGLFQWVSSLHQVAKVLELQLQHQSFQIQDWFPLGWTSWISLQSKGLSRVFSNNTAQKHQFFGAQSSLWSNSHTHTGLLEKP